MRWRPAQGSKKAKLHLSVKDSRLKKSQCDSAETTRGRFGLGRFSLEKKIEQFRK